MTPTEGQRTVRAAMHVVADTLTAHGFAAHAEDRGDKTAVIAEQCPFGEASTTNPVLCAVDRGMVKGLLAGLCGTASTGAPGDAVLAGPGRRRLRRLCLSPRWLAPTSTTPARPRLARRPSPRSAAGRSLPRADPGRLHEEGRTRARRARGGAHARWRAARGRQPRQVVFTSGATEADQRRRMGRHPGRPGAPVLCAAVEHSAVRDASARAAPAETLARRPHAGGIDVDALGDAPPVAGLPPSGARALPVGQPRGGHPPARPRGGRALPRRRA